MHDAFQNHADERPGRRHAGARLSIAPSWRELLASNDLNTLDDLFALINDASLTKPGLPGWRERLRVTLTDATGRKLLVYVKRFSRVPLQQQISRCWSRDPLHGTAWTEWTWLLRLAEAGIRAPEAIACGEDMVGWWERRSAVVLGAVGGVSLERWCTQRVARLPAPLTEAVAELVARFHALGIAHRDLYLSHIFGEALQSEAPKLSIIDLQRVVPMGRRGRRWIVKDLAALNYSTPEAALPPRDRLRWLKRYLQQRGHADQNTVSDSHVAGGTTALAAAKTGSTQTVRDPARSLRLRRRDRVMVRRIVGRTEQTRRHDARRLKEAAQMH